MQSPPFPRYLVPPRSKYSPQHHVLKHRQLPFLPKCQRPSFTPIQNKRLNYSYNILHPSTPRSPQWSPSLRFPHQDPIHPPLLTHTRHMPSSSHSSPFYHPHNIGWGVRAKNTSIKLPCYLKLTFHIISFYHCYWLILTFWRRNLFLILAHPVYKMWIIQEPNTLELWKNLHFEEENTKRIYHV